MSKYDFVVVGAGNAGLAAAIELVSKGYKTLLIEKHNLPGGCASSFVRGRFEFEASLHELCNYGPENNPGGARKFFENYGINVDFIKVPDCFRVKGFYSTGEKVDFIMPFGIENVIEAFEKEVPESGDEIRRLYEKMSYMDEAIEYFNDPNFSPKVFIKKYKEFLIMAGYSTKEVWDALKLSQKTQELLSTYWSYLGVGMKHLSFLHYSSMLKPYIERFGYIPTHTSHEMSNAILERYRELGGEVWFSCEAKKILFENGKACGVETNFGNVECDYVLANINPDILYSKLVDSSMVPKYEKKLSNARNKNYAARMMAVYFGLDIDYKELGINDYTTFIRYTCDSEKEYEEVKKGLDGNPFLIVNCYNTVNPNFSPEGTCVVSVTGFASKEEWENVDATGYIKLKERLANKAIEEIKKFMGIDIRPYIEEIEVAAPQTFARYIGIPEGSPYGYETRDWDSVIARILAQKKEYNVKGLRPIGSSGPMGDGYGCAYSMGTDAATIAIEELEKWRTEK